ncbi:MAG: TlpA family protein disulfide reductase [Desulfobacca sp.]|uniref:TlpA family protein disulfide reductase n=1 Tax=Desulfobacca sp. TaxID=2067990 RepID=UPI004049DB62
MHKRGLALFFLVVGLLTLAILPAQAGVVAVGDKLGDVEFPAPLSADDAKALGLAADKPFKLSQLGTPYLLVELFATSCPHCVHHAPIMNQVYGLLQKDAKLAGKVKVLGLAAGDSPGNVASWKKLFKVPFALVPDPEFKTYKAINPLGTPTTVLLNKNGEVLLVKAGAFNSAEDFLKEVAALVK